MKFSALHGAPSAVTILQRQFYSVSIHGLEVCKVCEVRAWPVERCKDLRGSVHTDTKDGIERSEAICFV